MRRIFRATFIIFLILFIFALPGCTSPSELIEDSAENAVSQLVSAYESESIKESSSVSDTTADPEDTSNKKVDVDNAPVISGETITYLGTSYKIVDVDGGDRSGDRLSNVAVDIGYGDRVYWGFTNQYGQLVYVYAKEIILQDDDTEPVNGNGRYYDDEAYVPGTERKDLDQGHVIADSLGGVSNAYNITPEDSQLNRYGNQAYMEDAIRKAGNGNCKDMQVVITYPDTTTMIPSGYEFTYKLMGETITDSFENKSE